ncbi:histidine--tRNA ligase [Bradyrhizobium sp. IC3069]|nr:MULTISPECIES: histidine--tRNA ligase [unclassified Bradyrhizobium]MCA1363321.1 histidine--tRNA ligase [Bradyrhizobium sp. IC4059]MCA1520261.1 histidine--tRNA ligase [Bradyrhizobium sp. IC3069]
MAEKPKKPQKLKARLPRGLEDRDPAAIRATREMLDKIRAVYELYGFEPVETPAMEYTDALGKFLPDQDRPNEGVFSFQDDDEQWISLRYDLTAPLARYVGERYGTDGLVLPYRSYRVGYVFRNEKPGPGRFRQFMQFDADTVGSATPAADAEICMMAADTMEALGIARGQYLVKVNNRKVLDGVLEAIGLAGEENAARRLTVLRAIDKLDKFSADEVRKLLGPGRWDGGEEGKGDFTKGANLSAAEADVVLAITKPREDWKEAIAAAETYLTKSEVGQAGVSELEEIAKLVTASGYGADRIKIDPSVVRGLEYYTGPVYEVELLLDTKDEKGRPVRFGSVGGGGRYDGLVSRFRGEPVPATGFSIGVSRLQAALTLLGKLDTRPEFGPVVVTVFDRDRVADYQKMVASLRGAGIRAELYLGNPKNMGNQLKYADRRNSPCVIIQGSDEKVRGEVQVKDLIEGAKAAAAIASNQEWRETRPAQFSCSEADLVAKVCEVLGRHDDSSRERTMPEITISMAEGRTDEQKAGMMRDITQALVKNLGVDADAVVIQINEAPLRHKMKGGKTFVERAAAAKK